MRFPVCSLLLLAASCQSLPQSPKTPKEALKMAADHLAAGENHTAIEALDWFGASKADHEERARWYVLYGQALLADGDPWDAYLELRDFIRENQFYQKLGDDLPNLVFAIGEQLARSNGSFWIFYSDRDRSKTVLSDFVDLFSTSDHMPDALHRLGEMSYEDGKYEIARDRFTSLITGPFRNNVWADKAAFRVAMCYFRRLEGPEYDLEEMNRAMAELTDFLESSVENPIFREQATTALTTVREWLSLKHISIAQFYATVGNHKGRIYHLWIAATKFPDTPGAKRAMELHARLTASAASAASEKAASEKAASEKAASGNAAKGEEGPN